MCRGILPLNELFKGQTSFVGAIVWVVVDMSYLEACLGESTGRWLRRGVYFEYFVLTQQRWTG